MAKVFYYGGSVVGENDSLKNQERNDIEADKKRSILAKKLYRSDLESQILSKKLEKLNKEKQKKNELIEASKKVKDDIIKQKDLKKEEVNKKMQLKEIYDRNVELVNRRKTKEFIESFQEEKKIMEYITTSEKKIGEMREGVNKDILKLKSKKNFQSLPKEDYKIPKKYDIGNEAEKKEFFQMVEEKQQKNELNFMKNVRSSEESRENLIKIWINKGISEENLKKVQRHEHDQDKKEFQTKLVVKALESQISLKHQMKIKQKNEDKAFVMLLNNKLKKEKEFEEEKQAKQKEINNKYLLELKSQILSSKPAEGIFRKLTEEENRLIKFPRNEQNLRPSASQAAEFPSVLSPYSKLSDNFTTRNSTKKFTGSLILNSQPAPIFTPRISNNEIVQPKMQSLNNLKSKPFSNVFS